MRDVSTQAPPLVIRVSVSPDLPWQRSREQGGQTRGKTAPHLLSGANPGVEARTPGVQDGEQGWLPSSHTQLGGIYSGRL